MALTWDELSEAARTVMHDLGEFGPTVAAENREIKGWTFDSEVGGVTKTYFDSTDLRSIASACIEVADWLDRRAQGDA